MTSEIAEKLTNLEYRTAFVVSQINVGIPFQIRALMKERGWTQAILAEKTDMLQPRISGLMTPGKTKPNIETLRRVAEAFDCGLIVRFAPFSELARWSEEFDPDTFSVPAFADDAGLIERKGVQVQPLEAGIAEARWFNTPPYYVYSGYPMPIPGYLSGLGYEFLSAPEIPGVGSEAASMHKQKSEPSAQTRMNVIPIDLYTSQAAVRFRSIGGQHAPTSVWFSSEGAKIAK